MEVWSWLPFRSTGVNPGKKQKCCSLSCLWFRVQRYTSGPGNSQTLGCLWTKHHRCTYMWNWTETPIKISGIMKGKTGYCIFKILSYWFLWVIELFCVWTRIIFDWCNKITTYCSSNVFEFDSIACLNFFVKEKGHKNFLEILMGNH